MMGSMIVGMPAMNAFRNALEVLCVKMVIKRKMGDWFRNNKNYTFCLFL